MDKPKRRFGERAVWIAVTAFLVAVLALLAFSPRVLAGNREADNQRLLEMFAGAFADVQKNYVDEVDPKVLIDGALKGMFESLKDPYSLFLNAEEMRDMGDTTTGKFGGVGLIISKVEGGVEVVSPIEDSPAFRAGVHAGDLIVSVDGSSVLELSIDQVLAVLRGQPGTSVTMTILRGKALRFDVTVVRAVIEVPTVKYTMMPGGIGYLRLIQFTPQTVERTAEALRSFQAAGYRALILDLRSNPGGLLQSAVDVANDFIARGPLVSTRSRVASENQVFYASSRRVIVPEELPVIVLLNRGSASASEILAGALQDTGRARIVGEKSYGKGSVQWIRSLGDEGYRLTIARYYTPNGRNIDKVGILPDVEVKEPELTPEEEKAVSALLEQNLLRDFVVANPRPDEPQIQAFLKELQDRKIQLPERYVRRLIRNEVNRTNDNPPLYDLEYDTALQKAVELLSK
jgi:carboxyl-terminal processing protease